MHIEHSSFRNAKKYFGTVMGKLKFLFELVRKHISFFLWVNIPGAFMFERRLTRDFTATLH